MEYVDGSVLISQYIPDVPHIFAIIAPLFKVSLSIHLPSKYTAVLLSSIVLLPDRREVEFHFENKCMKTAENEC
jgi:hypothetical protein